MRGQPRLVGLFSFYEADEHYVKGLKASMPYVDMWISHDDRGNKEYWYHEGKIRNKLIRQATEAGARWVICCDPDERYEERASVVIPHLVEQNDPYVYSFRLREMYDLTSYRVDGIWGRKRQTRLFPIKANSVYLNRPVHSPWMPTNMRIKSVELNLYHFKMMDPAKRVERVEIYNRVDQAKLQDYNYLADETHIKLEKIPYGREYRRDASLLQPAKLHQRSY